MARLTPVEYDPFAPNQSGPRLTPVEGDPFAEQGQSQGVARFAAPAIGTADTPPPYSNIGEAAIGAGKALGAGLVRGAVGLGTLPGNLEVLGRAGINAGAGLVGLEPPVDPDSFSINYNDFMGRLEDKVGPLYKPKTTLEKYIGTAGEFIPGAGVVGGLSKGARVASVVAPAVASETAGQLAEGSGYEGAARVAGALAGGSLANAGARVVSPAGRVDGVRARNVSELERQGVDKLMAGQRTGNQRIQSLEDATVTLPGGGRTQAMQSQQLEQFTERALEQIGVSPSVYAQFGLQGARATDEVLEYAAQQIGKRFENVGQVARVVPDSQFNTRLNGIVKTYENNTSQGNRIPAVQNYAQEIAQEAAQQGGMSGQRYLVLRSELRRAQRSGDRALKDATGRLVEQLDASVIRNAPKNLRPQVAKYIQDNNRQWRDFLAIRETMSRQGGVSSAGLISPQALNSAIKKQSSNLVSRNNRELGRLARAGDDVLRPLKSSGTAERNQAISMLKSPAATASSVMAGGLASGGDLLTMGASALVPYLMQVATARGITNPTFQKYMANQVMPGRINTAEGRQAINALTPFMLTRDDQ